MEIIWDIRDTRGDKAHGIHKIPNTFVTRTAKAALSLHLAVAGAAGYAVYMNPWWGIALAGSFIYVLAANELRAAWFYYAIIFVGICTATTFFALKTHSRIQRCVCLAGKSWSSR